SRAPRRSLPESSVRRYAAPSFRCRRESIRVRLESRRDRAPDFFEPGPEFREKEQSENLFPIRPSPSFLPCRDRTRSASREFWGPKARTQHQRRPRSPRPRRRRTTRQKSGWPSKRPHVESSASRVPPTAPPRPDRDKRAHSRRLGKCPLLQPHSPIRKPEGGECF